MGGEALAGEVAHGEAEVASVLRSEGHPHATVEHMPDAPPLTEDASASDSCCSFAAQIEPVEHLGYRLTLALGRRQAPRWCSEAEAANAAAARPGSAFSAPSPKTPGGALATAAACLPPVRRKQRTREHSAGEDGWSGEEAPQHRCDEEVPQGLQGMARQQAPPQRFPQGQDRSTPQRAGQRRQQGGRQPGPTHAPKHGRRRWRRLLQAVGHGDARRSRGAGGPLGPP
mmetsp:Transcript_105062/g.234498  ORF Transcript_105062/g.234498 Transcript_105062/m.234498 type:complete len:228 (+) Transcript_105062:624-1307(+)